LPKTPPAALVSHLLRPFPKPSPIWLGFQGSLPFAGLHLLCSASMPPKGSKRKATGAAEAPKKVAKVKTTKAKECQNDTGDASQAVAELVDMLSNKAWKDALAEEFTKPYFGEIAKFVCAERAAGAVHPPVDKVFSAFNETPLNKLRVVIIGQDPYHEPGQAHGMCFSVLPGVKPPPSLKNIYKELVEDVPGFKTPDHGYLLPWAQQGVLLLNATLTVREGHKEANSHSKCGWQKFTDEVIKVVNTRTEGVVFLLWGGFAQKKGKIVDTTRHRVLETGHPSPLSVKKWRGCKVFSKCNSELKKMGKCEIDWTLK